MGIYYEVYRSRKKRTILFLHGAWSNGTIWKEYVLHFKDYCAIVPDIRNHGRSARGNFSLEACAKDIELVLARENRRAVVIATSMGANIAMRINKKYLVKTIIFNFFHPKISRFTTLLTAIFRIGKMIVPPKISWGRRPIDYQNDKPNPFQIFAEMRRMHPHDFFLVGNALIKEKELSFNLPTIIIHGRKDIFTSKKGIEKLPVPVKHISAGHLSILGSTKYCIGELEKHL